MRFAVRVALALVLVAVAVPFALTGYGVLQNVWADYQDSSTSDYLLIGLPLVAILVACVGGAMAILRRPE